MKPSSDSPRRKRLASPKTGSGQSRWKQWVFRLGAAVLGPLLFLFLLEFALRLSGFGYPTGFLLQFKQGNHKYYVQNNRFGWRFFSRRMARVPQPIFIPQVKAPGTIRIFVFGESAAFGDPQPAFGLARMLQAVLEVRHPGTKFEVINVAMTGINSHVILPIAQDCARADADLWVLYMGNNEVVGPFGAGTVFGEQTPPLAFIRANVALKSWRIGQLFQALGQRKEPNEDWGGMVMFLNQQVRATDPKMDFVYHNFARNLRDILGLAARHGVGVVASTVAVNLKDSAPFASAHRPDLSASDLQTWQGLWQRGWEASARQDYEAAAQAWRQAAGLDDSYADLRFAQANAARLLARNEGVLEEYRAARDLDTLRFRCDRRLNEIIRSAAAGAHSARVALADSVDAFSKHSSDGVPGSDLFYDHVHLTFPGNYLLAQTIAQAAEGLLKDRLGTVAAPERPWPSPADCARRLGWCGFYQREAGLEMLRRLTDPPFTAQINHATEIERFERLVTSLAPMATPKALVTSVRECEAAFNEHPEDAELGLILATLANAAGEPGIALTAATSAANQFPTSSEALSLRGGALMKQRRFEEAAAAFSHVVELEPDGFYALNNLGRVLVEMGRTNQAIATFQRAVQVQPRFGPAWLSLGELLLSSGKPAEAQPYIAAALTNRIRSPAELKRLAVFCMDHGWPTAAATNYLEAAQLNPTDITTRLLAGQCFAAAGDRALAERCFADSVHLAPDSAPAHFLYGRALGQRNDAAGAEEHFRTAVRLMPDLVEARLNLAMSLANQGRSTDAIAEYESVLVRWPTNQIALSNLQRLRAAAQPH